MTIRVLVVDDSGFIRKRVAEMLTEDKEIEIVGHAANGADAVRLTAQLKPDVITMDVEMPVMDGISATRRIMRETPTPILMFSACTHAGARATLDALDAGAMDFLLKQLDGSSGDIGAARQMLRDKVRGLAAQAARLRRRAETPKPSAAPSKTVPPPVTSASVRGVRLVAIAASTGGPVALRTVLTRLPQDFPVPLLLVQHMPGNFTRSFAERLDQVCAIHVKEAEHGEVIQPGVAYLAPGGYQMELSEGAIKSVRIRENKADELYRPSADTTFTSISRNFPGKVLAVVLTGMGADGRVGAEHLKAAGAVVWAQSEDSCTVYGMPRAVVDARLADAVYDPNEMGGALKALS